MGSEEDFINLRNAVAQNTRTKLGLGLYIEDNKKLNERIEKLEKEKDEIWVNFGKYEKALQKLEKHKTEWVLLFKEMYNDEVKARRKLEEGIKAFLDLYDMNTMGLHETITAIKKQLESGGTNELYKAGDGYEEVIKHTTKLINDPEFKEGTEEVFERTCNNCNYKDNPKDDNTCGLCDDKSNWQPDEVLIEEWSQEQKRLREGTEPPCITKYGSNLNAKIAEWTWVKEGTKELPHDEPIEYYIKYSMGGELLNKTLVEKSELLKQRREFKEYINRIVERLEGIIESDDKIMKQINFLIFDLKDDLKEKYSEAEEK